MGKTLITAAFVKVKDLQLNTGQIEGLPANPRLIKDSKYQQLKQSITEDPEMLELREVIAYDNHGFLVVIAGNMRLQACKELGIKEVPCKTLPTDTPLQKLKAYSIKDNSGFGEWNWEMLANGWENDELEKWGMDIEEENEAKAKIQEAEIEPYIRTHVLLSFPPEKMIDLQPLLQQICAFSFVEYEQSNN